MGFITFIREAVFSKKLGFSALIRCKRNKIDFFIAGVVKETLSIKHSLAVLLFSILISKIVAQLGAFFIIYGNSLIISTIYIIFK